jgi:segregation and condensation protein A
VGDTRGDTYKAELEGIKAPLGVILYLIKRDNIDIYDIPIAKITKDYLDYLELMEELEIDLAGEFFVMAATLMRIKAQMLLRRDDEIEDPREELVRNLVEYKRIVEAARSMKEMEDGRFKVFTRPVPQNEKEFRAEPTFELSLYEIMRAFREIISRFDADRTSEIEPEPFTLEEKIDAILESLEEDRQTTFRELFSTSASRLEMVVTFMALLELIKRALIRCRQETAFGEIWIYRRKDEPTEESLEGSLEEPSERSSEKRPGELHDGADQGDKSQGS